MKRFFVCVYYFSHPEFPKECNLVRNHGILLRDILVANPSNDTHRKEGYQYDPAVDVGEYRVCQKNTRLGIKKRLDKYDELYLLFRTRYVKINKDKPVLVSGFFKVDKDLTREQEDHTIYASKMHFNSVDDAIDITAFMKKKRAHRASPNSENQRWGDALESWFEHIANHPNRIRRYKNLSQTLKIAFKANEFQNERYSECTLCEYVTEGKSLCPLVHRQNSWKISDMRRYYDIFYPT